MGHEWQKERVGYKYGQYWNDHDENVEVGAALDLHERYRVRKQPFSTNLPHYSFLN